MPLLDTLDLSGSKVTSPPTSATLTLLQVTDISALKKCKSRLKSLSLYNCKLPAATTDTVVQVLGELTELRNLDISDDKEDHAPFDMLAPGARSCSCSWENTLLLMGKHALAHGKACSCSLALLLSCSLALLLSCSLAHAHATGSG